MAVLPVSSLRSTHFLKGSLSPTHSSVHVQSQLGGEETDVVGKDSVSPPDVLLESH